MKGPLFEHYGAQKLRYNFFLIIVNPYHSFRDVYSSILVMK